MRIVYVIDKISCRGGQERILIDKMNYLAEHTAHEVVLMTIWHDTAPTAFPIHGRIRRVNLNVPIPNIPFGYAVSLPFAILRFTKYIRKENPDVTILLRAVGAFLAVFTSWNGKKVFESHTPYHASNHTWLYPKMQKNMDAVVCLTRGDAGEFNIAKRAEVIPNFSAINPTRYPDYSRKNIVFVGRDCPEKDIPRLKRIWAKMSVSHPDWILTIHNTTKDIVSAYLDGSILVMTSRAEGFGLVLVEAMACGLPCVAFDCPYGPRDIIEDGKTGYLIPYDDDQMFIDKLSVLMDDEALRRQMGEAAKVASQRYQPAPIMGKWLKLFTELAGS